MSSQGRDLASCPTPVDRAVMVQWWDELTFLHWRYPADVVQRLLPDSLEVEIADGSAWVGLVPFSLGVALPVAGLRRPLPWASRFAETNVRTYVRSRANGERGIWFFSLDAARLGAVVVARATYRLPYFWSRMRLEVDGDRRRYSCRRRWPGPRGAASEVQIDIGDPFAPSELSALDHFLTARWALFSAPIAGLRWARAWHEPWPLHRVAVASVHDDLVAAAGLPAPARPPLAHFSPSVEVRIGWPHRCRPV
jgi:uncharacterized protein YqjF (DUF2071 family)